VAIHLVQMLPIQEATVVVGLMEAQEEEEVSMVTEEEEGMMDRVVAQRGQGVTMEGGTVQAMLDLVKDTVEEDLHIIRDSY